MSIDTTIPEEGRDFTTSEAWHTADDGAKLYTKQWKPTSEPKARVLWIHGFSDYCNNTGTFLPGLARRGIHVFAFDQRGAGFSVHKPRDLGNSGPTPRVIGDITSIASTIPVAGPPLFMAGHSMGGGETLYYMAKGDAAVRARVRGYVAVAPLVGLSPATKPPRALEAVGRAVVRVLPRFQFKNAVKADLLSHDEAVCKAFETDEMCKCVGTLQLFQGMLDRGEELDTGKVVVKESESGREVGKTGLLVMHGTEDGITWAESSKRFVEKVSWQDKTYMPYEGWYHVMFREKGEDAFRFTEDFAKWVLARA